MSLDPELFKQLIESFSTELDEHAQAITKGLLTLEKNNLSQEEHDKLIEIIFRSAHNIKGTSFSLGINSVGDIAHSIESLFSDIQKKNKSILPEDIDACLNSVDKMRNKFNEFIQQKNNTQPASNTPSKPENTSLHDTHDYDSIRVPIHKIEKISSLLEEMQVNKIAMTEYQAELMQLIDIEKSTKQLHKHIQDVTNDLSILLLSMKEEVSQLRMIPVGNLLCTFPRYVRDLSHELNKNVELTLHGEEVKVDKAVLEGLKDPIIHLLRNAIDHGIESEATRKKLGKPEQGHITIQIKEEQALIKIIISDDGSGINIQKLSQIAESKNILTKAELERMSNNEKLELVFRSGFSTKDIITDVSGRGVGLDVVRSNIENLKGNIHISTVPGENTTFTLSVPLSIASERGLLIKCAGQPFVVPTSSVERVLLVKPDEIVNIQGGHAIILESKTIPFKILSDILQLENHRLDRNEKLSVMVIKRGGNILAFLVDEIIGEREIVIKSLHDPLTKIPCVSGGTLLESNQVIMVLDPSDLMTYALKQTQANHFLANTQNKDKTAKKHILVVDDSITTRTLEKNVLESKNYQVTVAVNGKEAWDILQKKKFSLLITDVMMPIMDGFTLTEQVKKSEKLRDLPVIIVTSLGTDAEKKRGIDVGADAYIVKNEFESSSLLAIVSQLV